MGRGGLGTKATLDKRPLALGDRRTRATRGRRTLDQRRPCPKATMGGGAVALRSVRPMATMGGGSVALWSVRPMATMGRGDIVQWRRSSAEPRIKSDDGREDFGPTEPTGRGTLDQRRPGATVRPPKRSVRQPDRRSGEPMGGGSWGPWGVRAGVPGDRRRQGAGGPRRPGPGRFRAFQGFRVAGGGQGADYWQSLAGVRPERRAASAESNVSRFPSLIRGIDRQPGA